MKTELVIFDLAGTTVEDNQDVPRILLQTLSRFDVYITMEEAISVMGISKPVAIRRLLEKYSDDLIDVTTDRISSIQEVFVRDMIRFYEQDPSVREKQGVSDTFSILKEHGIRVAVDTGFDRLITNVLLNRLGWLKNGLIDFSVTSDEVLRGRPFPDMIDKVMEFMHIIV